MIRFLFAALTITAAWAGDLAKANEYLRQVLETSDIPARIDLLQKSLKEQPSFAGHYNLGKALRDRSENNEAISEFRRALEFTTRAAKTDRAHAYFQIGSTMVQSGNAAEGLAYMQYSLALDKHPAVEQAILRAQMQLAGAIQPAAALSRAFVAASRDLVLDDSTAGAAPVRVSLWIQFEFDRADLNQRGIQQARELVNALNATSLPGYRFRVVGHTDLIGTAEYNKVLSLKRAQTVSAYLATEAHIARERLLPEGHGMDEPLITSGDQVQQAVNRRVDIVLVRQN
jgi:outer membrane protein OmpA-like peptidoglycan-associated protein